MKALSVNSSSPNSVIDERTQRTTLQIVMALVSIIIPTHNRESLILETLDSIEEQSFKDIEVIIVDDHSTDSSESIIKEYINKSSLNISYHKNKRNGACAARNYGIDLSHGDYIQFFDDDDIMYKDFIKTRLDKILSEHLDFAACNYLRFDHETGKIDGEIKNSSIPDNIVSHIYYYRLPTPCFLFTREAIMKMGYWDETVKRLQDMAYYHRIYLYGLKGAWMDEFLFKSRRHSATISKQFGKEYMIHAFDTIQKEWIGKNSALDNLLTCRKRHCAAVFKKSDMKKWILFNICEFINNPLSFITYFIKKKFIYKTEKEMFYNMI